MRLSNKRRAPYFNFIHTLLLLCLFAGIGFFVFERFSYKRLGYEENLLIIIPVIFLLIFYMRGKQIFEYDSDGEGVTVKNRHIIPYLYPPVSDEFPKYKIISYEIVNVFILKRLYLTIRSKKSSSLRLKYCISTLTKKELNDLKHSLSKIINANLKVERKTEQKV